MSVLYMAYIAAALLVINIATYIAYGMDKAAAEDGRRRISESTLLQLAMIGGSPAALIACQVFRHKTRKQPFRSLLLFIPVVQLLGLVGLAVVFVYRGP